MAFRITPPLAFLCLALLASPAPAEQILIRERLKPDENIRQLVAGLSDGDIDVRRSSAQKLADLGPAAMPAWIPLSAALLDTDSVVRERAIIALDRIGPRSYSIAGAALRTVLRRNEKSPDVGLAARTFAEWHTDLTLTRRWIRPGSDTLNRYFEFKGNVNWLREMRKGDWPRDDPPPDYPFEIESAEKMDFSELFFSDYLKRYGGNGYRRTGEWLEQSRLAIRGKVPAPSKDDLVKALKAGEMDHPRNAQGMLQLLPFAYAEMPREHRPLVWDFSNDLLALVLGDMRTQALKSPWATGFWSIDGRNPPRDFDIVMLDRALVRQMIVPALGHADENVRRMAIRSISDLTTFLPAEDQETLWKAVSQRKPDERDEIVQMIGRTSLAHPILRIILRRTADSDPDPARRLAALQLLEQVGDESRGLFALVGDDTLDLNLRITAVRLLRNRAVKDGRKILDQLDELERRLIDATALIQLEGVSRSESELRSAVRQKLRQQGLDLADKP
jgi:HEAT repeat protein